MRAGFLGKYLLFTLSFKQFNLKTQEMFQKFKKNPKTQGIFEKLNEI